MKGISWRNCLAVVIILVVLAGIGVAIYFAFQRWWSGNTISNAPPPLDAAILLLTLLVAIIAIYMGLTTWKSKRDWDAFEKKTQDEVEKVKADWEAFEEKQEPIIKETSEELEKLKEETKEINWLDKLRKSMKEDPHLDSGNAKETIQDIKKHYFGRDQYNEAWGYFGVARQYENEKQYSDAIKYHEKAVSVDLEEDNIESNELHKHIWQSLGKNYFLRGRLLEDDGKNAEAIKDYEAAIKRYDWVIEYDPQFAMAHFNKASTLIQLGKIEDKPEYYKQAISCLEKAIEIEDNYEHFYDKARAHALLSQPDEAIESLRHSFTLAERDNLGDLFRYLKRDSEDFKNVKGKEEFKALVKRY